MKCKECGGTVVYKDQEELMQGITELFVFTHSKNSFELLNSIGLCV
ncbi:hypothetical protein K9M79_06675 [Candidatus Woesearchaeota archaeon]|nr:hypothetical protein [Candidatus Woesearchaeota archaeon]